MNFKILLKLLLFYHLWNIFINFEIFRKIRTTSVAQRQIKMYLDKDKTLNTIYLDTNLNFNNFAHMYIFS